MWGGHVRARERTRPRTPSSMPPAEDPFITSERRLVDSAGYVRWRGCSPDRAQVVRDSLRAIAAGPARPDTTKFAAPTDLTPIRRARALRTALDAAGGAALLRTHRGIGYQIHSDEGAP